MISKEALTNLKLDVSCRGRLSKFQQRCFDILEKEFEISTLEEVKKEWEEKGWEWSRTTTMIYIAHLTQKKSIGITSNNLVKINGWLDLQELELLTKTLKALEVRENE